MDFNGLLGPFGPNGPYYTRPCQRDRFPSLVDEVGEFGDSLVEHLGVSNIEDMGFRYRRGRKHTKEEELRDANENLLTGCPHTSQRLRTAARGMQRAHDRFVPRLARDPPQNPQQMRRRCGRVLMLPTAEPQSEEPPYEGKCDHCRRQSPDDEMNDFSARYMAMCICDQPTRNNQHQFLHGYPDDVNGQLNMRNG